MIRLFLLVLFGVSCAGMNAVQADSPSGSLESKQYVGQGQILDIDPEPLQVHTPKGSYSFKVEIADEVQEQSTGLMFRTQMDDDHGMLFLFPVPRRGSFWMMNTILPLDIVFIRSDGGVDSVRRGEPFSLDPILSNGPIQYVLELNAGMAEKAGIIPGVRVEHPLMANQER